MSNFEKFMDIQKKRSFFFSNDDAANFFRSLELEDVRISSAILYDLIKRKFGLYNFSKMCMSKFSGLDNHTISIDEKEKILSYAMFNELFPDIGFFRSSSLSGTYLINDFVKIDGSDLIIKPSNSFKHELLKMSAMSRKEDFLDNIKRKMFNFDPEDIGKILEMKVIRDFLSNSIENFPDNDTEGLLYEIRYLLERSEEYIKFCMAIIDAEKPERTYSSFSNYTLFSIFSRDDFNALMSSINLEKMFDKEIIEMFSLV